MVPVRCWSALNTSRMIPGGRWKRGAVGRLPALLRWARGGKWASARDDEPYGGDKEMRRELEVRPDGAERHPWAKGLRGSEEETGGRKD